MSEAAGIYVLDTSAWLTLAVIHVLELPYKIAG
jgi:hypothetical protein